MKRKKPVRNRWSPTPKPLSQTQFETLYYPVAKGAMQDVLRHGIKTNQAFATTQSGAKWHLSQGTDIVAADVPSHWVQGSDYGTDTYSKYDIPPFLISGYTDKYQKD